MFSLFVSQSCINDNRSVADRPRDPWAFRSVLDKHPRMLTLALDTNCYVAYDLAHCTLYKVWKGGVNLEGAAYTDKKNIQPTTWGTAYSDSLPTLWTAEINGQTDSFRMVNRGYRFSNDRVFLQYAMILSTGDTVSIEESPEYLQNESGEPGLERQFTLNKAPAQVAVFLNARNRRFPLSPNKATVLTEWFKKLPEQTPPVATAEYDHRGWYWMEKSDCFTCHELDQNTVGPSLRAIAGRYKKQERGGLQLVNKVKYGGSGTWGNAMMTPHPDLTENEIRVMLDYIFSLEPDDKAAAPANITNAPKKTSRPGHGAPLETVHPSFDLQTIHRHDFKPKVGGLAFLPDGRLLVTTWDSIGAVYALDGVETGDTNKITVKRIASGLAEPLGIEVVNGEIYVMQKQELTKLIDLNGDDITDQYQAVCNSWGVTGDFHEFAFGLVYKDGYFYATLSMAMRLMANERQQPDRGKAIKIGMDGSYESINYGLRTPNGIGVGVDNEIFVTDNQGEWVPANKLIHIKAGEYHGMRWGHLDSTEPPEVALPAVWLPEDEIGNSPSEPVLIKEGPYKGQMLHGDVTHGGIKRDFLEKINGQYQGAVFRFTQGLEAGVNRLRWGTDGALYVGGVGMTGGWGWKEKQYGLQRLSYNGKPVFEMLAVRARPKGFEIEFTQPLHRDVLLRPQDFDIQQWWYEPTADYGGPKKELQQLTPSSFQVSSDRRRVSIDLPGLKEKRVVYIRLPEQLKSENGLQLWSSETWYTLNNIPSL